MGIKGQNNIKLINKSKTNNVVNIFAIENNVPKVVKSPFNFIQEIPQLNFKYDISSLNDNLVISPEIIKIWNNLSAKIPPEHWLDMINILNTGSLGQYMEQKHSPLRGKKDLSDLLKKSGFLIPVKNSIKKEFMLSEDAMKIGKILGSSYGHVPFDTSLLHKIGDVSRISSYLSIKGEKIIEDDNKLYYVMFNNAMELPHPINRLRMVNPDKNRYKGRDGTEIFLKPNTHEANLLNSVLNQSKEATVEFRPLSINDWSVVLAGSNGEKNVFFQINPNEIKNAYQLNDNAKLTFRANPKEISTASSTIDPVGVHLYIFNNDQFVAMLDPTLIHSSEQNLYNGSSYNILSRAVARNIQLENIDIT